jgi:tetratricopeptide (TPR) repeat protein
MFREFRTRRAAAVTAGLFLLSWPLAISAQERRNAPRIDVATYRIEAEVSPNTQTIAAKAIINFVPLDDTTNSATFELNNALNVSRVLDAQGKQIAASRNQQDSTVRLSFDQPLAKGQPTSVTFYYDGRLTGQEDSPVEGIKFAAIHPDFAYLMYPARWFPVSGYTTDRFGADMLITVPTGYSVLGSGADSRQAAADKNVFEFKMDHASFPGSIAVVKGDPQRVQSEGVTTSLYFRGPEAEMTQAYGDETGKVMSYFTGTFGLPPVANLTVVETEAGAPNGYAAPGLIFLAPAGILKTTASRLIANEVSRQWWEEMVSGSTRNQIWLTNGLAAYSELLWTEHTAGAAAMEKQLNGEMINALTLDNVPILQSSRLDDYSPEFWALTGSKGAAVVGMLRYVMGDEKFFQALKNYSQQNTWKSVSTDEFRKAAEAAAGRDLNWFFMQWVESSNAPEFRLEYTIYRISEPKGFRIMGKISQDMDIFRMPVDLKIETESNPEEKKVEVVGTSSEFSVDTFGKPKSIVIDPNNHVLRFSPQIRVAVAIRRGEQFAMLSEFPEAVREYQKALETNKLSSLAHYRIAEVDFLQDRLQESLNEFRQVLDGDQDPQWTLVWAHIHMGWIYDITGQRERAVNEYNLAQRTKDNTQGAQDVATKYLKAPYQREHHLDQ